VRRAVSSPSSPAGPPPGRPGACSCRGRCTADPLAIVGGPPSVRFTVIALARPAHPPAYPLRSRAVSLVLPIRHTSRESIGPAAWQILAPALTHHDPRRHLRPRTKYQFFSKPAAKRLQSARGPLALVFYTQTPTSLNRGLGQGGGGGYERLFCHTCEAQAQHVCTFDRSSPRPPYLFSWQKCRNVLPERSLMHC